MLRVIGRTLLLNRYLQKNLFSSTTMANSGRQWNPKLSSEQLSVLRDKGTERPYTGTYLDNKENGVYHCANCEAPLYSSGAKFDSGCGWPAFYQEVSKDALSYNRDGSLGMERVEICCGQCGGHLGHVFEGEGWQKMLGHPTDARHCVNSASLTFASNK